MSAVARSLPTAASWTLAEIAALSGGRLAAGDGAARFEYASISTDTRTLRPGDFFIALRGATHDGHDHLPDAIERGARAVFVDRPIETRAAPASSPVGVVMVGDTLEGWQRWGAGHRASWRGKLVAITGSSGKTTTKNALAHLLRGLGPVWSTPGNRNNHVGVPWSLLGLSSEHRFAVLELGMNHEGEIAALSALARPDLALITSVGRAHIGLLGSREAILRAKLEIAEGLGADAPLVLPDDPWVLERLPAEVRLRPRITFGLSPEADWSPVGAVEYGARGTRFATRRGGRIELRLLGGGAVLSALAALATIDALGLDTAELVPRLRDLEPEPMRMEARPWRGAEVIVDCYNASPESTRLAIAFLASVPHAGRKVLVLGELSELGRETEAIHRELVRSIRDIEIVLLVGPELAGLVEEAKRNPGVGHVEWKAVREEASTWLADALEEGDLVLLKASRRLALERILEGPIPGPPRSRVED